MADLDWTNPADYEYFNKLDAWGKAWEFLRRNHDYRNDYLALSSGKINKFEYSPPKLNGESDNDWLARCVFKEGVTPRRKSPTSVLLEKWGLRGALLDPTKTAFEHEDDGTPVAFNTVTGANFLSQFDDIYDLPTYEDSGGPTMFGPDILLAAFDLDRPIGPQIRELRQKFRSAKESLIGTSGSTDSSDRPKSTTFINGLRVLDGFDAGFSKPQIKKTLFEDFHGSNIDDLIDSAEKNRDIGYLAIAKRKDFIKSS